LENIKIKVLEAIDTVLTHGFCADQYDKKKKIGDIKKSLSSY
jgi:hypothetical protein